jgi:hypothetical protein
MSARIQKTFLPLINTGRFPCYMEKDGSIKARPWTVWVLPTVDEDTMAQPEVPAIVRSTLFVIADDGQLSSVSSFGKFVFMSDKPDFFTPPKIEYKAVPVVEETKWEEPAATN